MAGVGIVVVSHSRALADAAVELALQMVHGDRPPIAIAAGMPDGGLGTDATEVMSAITEADAGAGVVVIMDLGSAILSAEMALELLDDMGDELPDIRVVGAPFVEGLLAAAVRAAGGASLDEVASEARSALEPKLQALGDSDLVPDTSAPAQPEDFAADASGEGILPNEAGLHARPAAMMAAEAARFQSEIRVGNERGKWVHATTPIGLATLAARKSERLRIEARGEDARAAVDALVAMVTEGFGEVDGEEFAAAPATGTDAVRMGVSPGRVVGPAHAMAGAVPQPQPATLEPDDVDLELERLREAVTTVSCAYREVADASEPEAAEILTATAALATDETLTQAAADLVTARRWDAASAFWKAAEDISATMSAAGGRLAERTTDVADIRDRVVATLLDLPMPGVPDIDEPFVLLARDLAPSDTATLDPDRCLAIVTAEGGPTSHTSILARALGIPAVVGVAEALDIPDGTPVLVDGGTGEVVVDPDEAQRATARTAPQPLEPLTTPGATSDGHPVPLLANVGSGRDARSAVDAGAEGVGLFRTEFAFLDRADEPSVAEQVRAYAEVLEAFPARRVVIRTLDAGSDKPMPFLTLPGEANPALGVRGYRTARQHPDVLRRQLEAIVIAGQDTRAEVWVMAPMISTAREAADFAELARSVGVGKVGVMVETPSAALQAEDLLAAVDFVSIGTNDLGQYTLAVDRQGAGLGDLQDPWQPALLRLVRQVGEAGSRVGKPVGVCGEAAADPDLAPVLVGLGISSLSMSGRALSSVGAALGHVTAERCREAAEAACRAMTAEDARMSARAVLAAE